MMPSLLGELKQTAIANTLRHCPLFAAIPLDCLNTVAAMTVMKTVAKGEYLFMEGTPVRGFYVMQKGAIKLHRLNRHGQGQVFHIARAPESFAEESMLSGTGYSSDASAVEDSNILLVQGAEFLHLLKRHPDLAFSLLKSVSHQVRSMMSLVNDRSLKDFKTRLAHWLIQHCAHPDSGQPQRVPLQMTKRLLASELGVTSETLSRTLAKFRKQHLVHVEGRIVTLISPLRLAESLQDNVDLQAITA